MSIADWPARDREGLAEFYAAGHDWTWMQLRAGDDGATRSLLDWLEKSPAPRKHPLLLPRVERSALPRWYAVAFSEVQAEELREQLNAFLGPAGTDFDGLRADMDPNDPPEAAIAAWAGGPWVYRFNVLSQARRSGVRDALSRLREIWRLRPLSRGTVARTTEALLSEFFSSLSNHDELASQRWLDELRAGGRLSAENLTFLLIEQMAAFGRWSEIAALPQLSQIVLIARPRFVTALLIEMIWRTELATFAVSGDAPGALTRFQAEIAGRYQPLLRTRGDLVAPPVVLTFLLAALADPGRRGQVPALLALLPEGPERAFGELIAALNPAEPVKAPPAVVSPLETAQSAFERGDYDTAWGELQKAAPSVESCRYLLECAAEIDTAEAAGVFRKALESLAPSEREAVLARHLHRRAWEELQRLESQSGEAPLDDWESWFGLLEAEANSPRLLPTAHEATFRWLPAAYLSEPARVGEVADLLLASRSPEAEAVLRLALPHLLAFFSPDGHGAAAFLPFYKSALFLIRMSAGFGTEDWATAQTLLLAVLDAGPSRANYEEAAHTLAEFWENFGSVLRLDWALDTLNLLAAHPAPDTAARDFFFNAVRVSMAREYRRVRPEQWDVFRWLAIDLGCQADYESLRPASTTVETPGDAGVDLAGRIVGIYTLTESAGARAQAVIESLFPGVEVRLSHDHVGTERLRSLSREAEYFIVATQSSKHAATDFIKEHRPARLRPLIYPTGKGSSSIVTALQGALTS